MAKIIKVTESEVTIAKDDSSVIKVLRSNLDFEPASGEIVEVYDTGEEIIVHRSRQTTADNLQDKININIVNENNNSQSQIVYGAGQGRLVNKMVYALLAIFLGTFGVHQFYAGKIGSGFMYLIFSWTGIPTIVSLFQGISALLRPADANGNIFV
ncbi:TM2 domain-containing protein [Streptococcus panodentis]|nr:MULTISPECIES: TM2 domain-containing protein [Streptococcus]KXT84401.1 hypothetical protein STRDD11_00992 [Streptococcus sp. DD11]